MGMALFEALKEKVGCEYISDMRRKPCLSEAKRQTRKLSVETFSIWELTDIAEYLYGEKPDFSDTQAARSFFSGMV